jgi:prepilin-type N-terminal cleavage/methylation domain-containing protein
MRCALSQHRPTVSVRRAGSGLRTLVAPCFRRAFTLVELLVAIAIFVILATIAISAFRESDQDRAAAGAQQLRSMLEGARSRAIHDGLPRGLRLLLDPSHPRRVTSLVYIGAPRQYIRELTLPELLGPDGVPGSPGDDDGNGTADDDGEYGWEGSDDAIKATVATSAGPFTPVWTITEYVRWPNLYDRGLLRPTSEFRGARIKIPAEKGNWFPITRVTRTTSPHAVTITLAGQYGDYPFVKRRDNHHNSSFEQEYYAAIGTGNPEPVTNPIRYILELAPPILPGSSPKPLANGMGIDLDGSKLPAAWQTGGNYIPRMDILFSPRGEVIGEAGAAGILHFIIADVEDIANGTRYTAPDQRAPALRVEKKDRLVTLFTRTGLVLTSPVNHFDATASPYEYALLGKDAP